MVTLGETPWSAVATNATQLLVLPATRVGQVTLAPGTIVPPQAIEAPPPGPQYGRVGPVPPADVQPQVQPPPAGYIYRDEIPPRETDPRAVQPPPLRRQSVH